MYFSELIGFAMVQYSQAVNDTDVKSTCIDQELNNFTINFFWAVVMLSIYQHLCQWNA